MKNIASPIARATASAVSSANESGRARTTRPSHALARASWDSARKSDMVFLEVDRKLRAVARHPRVRGPDDEHGGEARDLEAPRRHLTRRGKVVREYPAPEHRVHRQEV